MCVRARVAVYAVVHGHQMYEPVQWNVFGCVSFMFTLFANTLICFSRTLFHAPPSSLCPPPPLISSRPSLHRQWFGSWRTALATCLTAPFDTLGGSLHYFRGSYDMLDGSFDILDGYFDMIDGSWGVRDDSFDAFLTCIATCVTVPATWFDGSCDMLDGSCDMV